ncbi:MAG: alpha/beta fold hydrolase [Omnitrophica WOR_2 bacterium]
MTYININDFRMFYETYGTDVPGVTPVILIHGFPSTGHIDWGLIAPWLSRHYYVIVPDCRGHGQSTNPEKTYSFKQLAGDIAALVKTLGYPRAHIIGHSNGGNTALVVLMEHPEIVQTCVIQAANAYVSQDFIEKEPAKFDPDRLERENPELVQEWIELHDTTNGKDYWRDLIRMGLHEIITEPNYSPADLSRAQRPALVIQGQNDWTNAESEHAQYIARHIPDAELWIPEGIGHNVQNEIPGHWIDHITEFIDRRGTDANDALYRLRRHQYHEEGETIFHVSTAKTPGGLMLSGEVLTAGQRQAALDCIQEQPVTDQIKVLLNESAPWALVKRAVTDLRRKPGSLEERVTQSLLGESVRVLKEIDDWSLVRLERDGYLGWIQRGALTGYSMNAVLQYQESCNSLVISEAASITLDRPHLTCGNNPEITIKIPFGVHLYIESRQGDRAYVCLPDGNHGWVPSASVISLSERPTPDQEGIQRTLALMKRSSGVPYLWGGRSSFGYDCSGFSQTFLSFLDVKIRRDAHMQFEDGIPVEEPFQPGDLLFFGRKKDISPDCPTGWNITHVAVSLGKDEFIHANGAAWSVSYNSFDPASPIFRADLKENFAGARRYV